MIVNSLICYVNAAAAEPKNEIRLSFNRDHQQQKISPPHFLSAEMTKPKRNRPFARISATRSSQSAILLGAHMSIGGGAHMAIERACSIQCTAMQIFVKNNMQWFARPLERQEITAFLKHRQRRDLQAVFAHANYLINLAATNPQFHFNSMRALGEGIRSG